jgi:hypothetical protein
MKEQKLLLKLFIPQFLSDSRGATMHANCHGIAPFQA